MKTYLSHDYFYYNPKYKKKHTDFTGDDSFTPENRMDFLKHYAKFLNGYYKLPDTPQEVVTEAELNGEMHNLDLQSPLPQISERMEFNTVSAFLQEKPQEYNGWQLYTNKTSIRNDAIIFDSDNLPPTGAAAYFFDSNARVTEFTFSFYMDSLYNAEIPGGILDTTYGRTVELRSGIEDIIKLQFYSDGKCYARLGNTCPYHLKNVFVGDFKFCEWQTVKVTVFQNTFNVEINENVTKNLALSGKLYPNTLYIGCGMFNVGNWKFKPINLKFENKDFKDFFTAAKPCENAVETLGEVSLPFSVGGYKNRNKYLILEKEFSVSKEKKAFLNIESLDPCGRIYINGSLIAVAHSFDSFKTEITDYLKQGINHLRIVVDPRAPEVLFNWHRQKDAYNGWFCNAVWIDFYNKLQITDIEALTLDIEENNVKCNLKASVSAYCKVNAFIRKIFPIKAETEQFIGALKVADGKINEILNFKADSWSPENPNLYSLRLEALNQNGTPIDDAVCETGFRTIRQSDGKLLLNGKPTVLTGALLMQFLPPHSETPVTHICPTTEQVLWQELMLKRMNGNTMRIHILGYGTNDSRYARIADRLGLMLIWTTRYIDSVEQMALQSYWAAKDGYLKQIKDRINNPSIIMWEGTNEYHPTLNDIDRIYEAFVPSVKSVDTTRLICPISHLYYAGDMIPKPDCAFYNDTGTADHQGNNATATEYWCDELVVRSAHTYEVLLGYGTPWRKMRNQEWSMQNELFESKNHAYIVSEFAVTARQNPNSEKAAEFFNPYSYEFPDENVLGFRFKESEWQESQAYQALAAKFNVKVMREHDADGMLWCCLMGGANDAGYLKPPIDCYGYPKYAFYTLKEGYAKLYAADSSLDAVRGDGFEITPTVFGTEKNRKYNLKVTLTDHNGTEIENRTFCDIIGNGKNIALPSWQPQNLKDGYYALLFKLDKY